jgi:lipopolysaccharide assembly outer membrane protein LptD (OstA)
MMKKRILFLILLLLIYPALAQKFPEIMASKYNLEKEKMIFEGDVIVSLDNVKIFCDKLVYDTKSKIGIANGNIQVKGDEFFFNVSSLKFDFNKHNFVSENVFALIKPDISFKAEKVEKVDKRKYIFHKGFFTTCTQCNPRWKIELNKAIYVEDDRIEVINALFKIKSVPAFYLPYFYYPIKSKKRKTGFLMPFVGYSTFKGYMVKESFFWAIKDNIDLTINGEYNSLFGKGVSGEFRSGDANGNFLNFSGTYLKDDKNINYIVKGGSKINFSDSLSLYMNTNFNSGLNFIQNYSDSFNYALTRNFYSNIYLKKNINKLTITLSADQSETFYSYTDLTRKIRHLPSLNIELYKTEILPKTLYFSFKAGGKNTGKYTGEDWLSVNKLYLNPSVSLNLKPVSWLTFDFDYTLKNYLYLKSYEEIDGKKTISDKNLYFNQSKVRVSIIGPTFYKVYDTSRTNLFYKIKHTIEPSITYRYVQMVDDKSMIIPLDWEDYFFYYNQIDFTLTNRIYAKTDKDSTSKEIMNFGFSQSYFLNPLYQRLYFFPPSGVDKKDIRWSEKSMFLRVNPSSNFYLSVKGSYNQYYKSFRNLSVSFNAKDDDDRININYSYNRLKRLRPDNLLAAMEFMRGKIELKPSFLPLEFTTFADYNIQSKELYSAGILLKLKFQCIDFNFQVRRRGYITVGSDTQFLFSIGFGTIKPSVSTMENLDF